MTLVTFLIMTLAPIAIESKCEKPRLTFIDWEKLRVYLNKYHDTAIMPTATGDSLPVTRCGSCFHLCDENTLCGIETQEYARKVLTFRQKSLDGKIITKMLIVQYLQDESCRCVPREKYKDSCDARIVPPISHVIVC